MERGWRLLGSYNSPYTDYPGSGFRSTCMALFKEPGKVSCTFHHSVHHTIEERLIRLAKFTDKYCSSTEYNVTFSFCSNEKFPI